MQFKCPRCHNDDISFMQKDGWRYPQGKSSHGKRQAYVCLLCGRRWCEKVKMGRPPGPPRGSITVSLRKEVKEALKRSDLWNDKKRDELIDRLLSGYLGV